MIVSRSDPYGLRGMVRPGRAEEPGEPRARALRDKPENVRRCKTCTVPAELCYGLCRSDADQERARQGRRPAPEGKFVDRISSFLSLSKEEHEQLLDLAADSRQTVPADLPDYIRKHDIVRAALRVAKEVDATDEEWTAFMEMLKSRQS